MSAQETHGGHIIPALMAALVARASGLAINGPGERIAFLPMNALRHGPRAKPRRATKQHQYPGGQRKTFCCQMHL
jgi:hypothetical protein